MTAERRSPREASVPREAASVILLRDGARHGERGLEVLMVKRTETSRFMPGVWVFPGGVLSATDGSGEAGLRRAALRELSEEAGVQISAPTALVPFARWITPEAVPIRFDALFFLAKAPPHCRPRPDGHEVVDARWFEPRRALASHVEGQLELAFPTIKQLETMLGARSPAQLIASAAEREISPILPKVIGEGSERRVVLPGEPGYD